MYVTLNDDTQIYYNVNGKESAIDHSRGVLIFLHGGPGLVDHTPYLSFWSKLSDLVEVVFIDMRGHGRSSRECPENWTLEQWGRDVYEFCQILGIQDPIIAGLSFGGWVALSYATQYPEHAKALMLCHTEARVNIEVRKQAYARKAKRWGQDEQKISDIVQRICDWENGKISRELYLKYCIPLYSKQLYTAGNRTDCISNFDVWDIFGKKQYEFDFLPNLHNIKIPVLVMTGEHDSEHPPEFSMELAMKLEHAELVIMERAGVPTYLDRESETLKILRQQVKHWLS